MSSDASTALSPAIRQQEFLLSWLREDRPEPLEQLWRTADLARAQFAGDAVGIWGAIKVSNHCVGDCVFCGLRAGNREVKRYRMDADEILACARHAAELGCQTVLLQSGRDPQLADGFGDVIRRIREQTGLAVALSLGERSEGELAAWRQAGAASYLLRFMTANPTLYRLLHCVPVADPRQRLPLLATLKQLGYKVGSGILVGFPGQSHESLADDLALIHKLDLDIVMVGPYIWPDEFGAWHRTPQPCDANSAQTVMKVMALARQLCPSADIPVGSALATVGSLEAHGLALQRGASTVTVDLTPARMRDEYRCYPDRVALTPAACENQAETLRTMVARWRGGAATATAAGQTAPAADNRLHVCICMGSSCFSRGNNRMVAAVKALMDGQGVGERIVLEGHLCEGLCKHGPNVMIDGELQQHAHPAEVIEAIRRHPKLKE
jgi:biotin synthase